MAPPSPRDALAGMVSAYCSTLGGDRPIRSILIANNGIAAVKFINSIRTWAYETFGEERCIQLFCMATPDDMRANAEHIRMADGFVEVAGGTNNNNYANVNLIVEVAERLRVDAVWPGWGHASENPQLPQDLSSRGIAFLGPPASAMAALGDKIGSTILAQGAGIPTIPWSGSGVVAPELKAGEDIPEDIYQQACVHSSEQAVACCERIGFPAMIKASWGGGGKGIRKVFNEDEVVQLFKQVQGEVPGSPIFVMKMASQSRHLEVQLACDSHGNIVSLHSRDCSIQRRHQKIIEEGPITIAPESTVRSMEAGARRLAKMIGYMGVATVEYLYSMETGEYFFLEVNPRLQVEHPVTEWIADVNIPSVQLSIAMGIPLWRLPEIRRFFGQEGGGPIRAWKEAAAAPPLDLGALQSVPWGTASPLPKPKGHVVAVRITSEDPDDGFKPTCGKVDEISFRSKPDVWAYFSIKSGGQIHEFSDSQFGHIFAFGATRPLAIANMVLALKQIQIRGEIRTIVDYVVDLLKDEEYQGNRIHTGWLDSRIAKQIRGQRLPWHVCVIAGALHRVTQHVATRVTEYIGYLEKGQIPPVNVSLVEFEEALNIDNCKYTVRVTRRGPGMFSLRLAGSSGQQEVLVHTHTLRDGGLLVQLDGTSHVVYAEEETAGTRLLVDGRTCLLQNEHDPSVLVAETPCKLMRYLAEDGAHLAADQAYAEVEVMKMCMPLLTPAAGTLRRVLPEGQAMKGGDVVARLDLDDPSAVKRSAPFTGDLPALGTPTALPEKEHHKFQTALSRAHLVLDGYAQNVDQVVQGLLHGLSNCDALPLLQWQDTMAVLATRLPKPLKAQLDGVMEPYERGTSNSFPARFLLDTIEEYLDTLDGPQRTATQQLVSPLVKLAEDHSGGPLGFRKRIAEELLGHYLRVESLFSQRTQTEVVETLRQTHKKELARVVEAVLSHQGVKQKNELALRVLDSLVASRPQQHRATLEQLAALSPRDNSQVVLRASQLLLQVKLKALQAGVVRNLSDLGQGMRRQSSAGELRGSSGQGSAVEERIQWLVESPGAIDDALACLFSSPDVELRTRSMETYVRRLYQVYLVKGSVKTKIQGDQCAIATWHFWEERPPPSVDTLEGSEAAKGLGEGYAAGAHALRSKAADGGRGSAPVIRWGMLLVAPSAKEAGALLGSVLNEAQSRQPSEGDTEAGAADESGLSMLKKLHSGLVFLSGAPSGGGNVVHLALSPQVPLDASAGAFAGTAAAGGAGKQRWGSELLQDAAIASALRTAGVSAVSCMLLPGQPSESTVVAPPERHCFHWTDAKQVFQEQLLWQHVEPPLSVLLELDRLAALPNVSYRRSRNGLWHILSSTDAAEKPPMKRLFLRAVVRLSGTAQKKIQTHTPGLLDQNGVEEPEAEAEASAVAAPGAATPEPSRRCMLKVVGSDGTEILAPAPFCVLEESNVSDGAPGWTPGKIAVPCQNHFYPCRLTAAASASAAAAATGPVDEELAAAAKDIAEAINAATSEAELDADMAGADHVQIFMAVPGALRLGLGVGGPPGARTPGPPAGDEWQKRTKQVLCQLGEMVDALVAKGLHCRAVSEWEARVRVSASPDTLGSSPNSSSAWRIVVQNPSKFACSVQVYMEAGDTRHDRNVYFSPPVRSIPRSPMGVPPASLGSPVAGAGAAAARRSPLVDRQEDNGQGVQPRQPSLGFGNTGTLGFSSYQTPAGAGSGVGALATAPSEPEGPLHCTPLGAPCGPLPTVTRRRVLARRAGTTYCYDFLDVFSAALSKQWEESRACGFQAQPAVSPAFFAKELVFKGPVPTWDAELVETERAHGSNKVGMVGWRMRVATPEYPQGRPLLVVANDVTLGAGAFGLKEDMFFHSMALLACRSGVPLVYLAANSGARIGVAEEVKRKVRAAWVDEQSPEKGLQYLYLAPEDYEGLKDSVIAHKVEAAAGLAGGVPETRWVVTDIIGAEDGLGVENLSGSAAIASAFSRAYKETFTLTYVTGRTVGIGAYLARLGSRCIQRLDQPIILTGYSALNKLLGREVYTSHMQLGGPMVMATNGVVHNTVRDDLEGASALLRWLSFVPALTGTPVPRSVPVDPTSRAVEYMPVDACRPRAAIAGTLAGDGTAATATFVKGIFDDGSFMEALQGWAQGVVVGRARLGGVPVGVISVETATVMQSIPADPGQLDSAERTVPKAGQVWFPDSAAKTAQALLDFGLEGLPLFVLANWRGFSGGQRDLFEGILQAGSLIVDRLREYQRPAFVYIPKTGELRGGAWVVVDSKINPSVVEMYAESSARGAVLEPEGTVEIKFREAEIKECMKRLDGPMKALRDQLQKAQDALKAAQAQGASAPTVSGLKAEAEAAKRLVAKREKELMPVYHQLAVSFAALHDTPRRMQAKGTISAIVPWAESRSFFSARLRRRQMEDEFVLSFAPTLSQQQQPQQSAVGLPQSKATPGLPKEEVLRVLKAAFVSQAASEEAAEALWRDDSAVLSWLEAPGRVEALEKELSEAAATSARRQCLEQLLALGTSQGRRDGRSATVVDGILAALASLSVEEKQQVVLGVQRLG